MPGILRGSRGDGLPIIQCALAPDQERWAGHGEPPRVPIRALIDIGATHVVATTEVIGRLGLPFITTITNTVVGGVRQCAGHSADIFLEGRNATGAPHIYSVTGVLVLSESLSGYDAIIGWDVLRFLGMRFNHDGSFELLLP